MADLYTNTNDGLCIVTNQINWAAARDNAGLSVSTSGGGTTMVGAGSTAARGGGVLFKVYRSFFYFDTSSITGTVTSASLKLKGWSGVTSGSIIAVKSTAFGGDGASALVASDFNNITGYHAAASLSEYATNYSTAITTTEWNAGGSTYTSLPGTADLKSDMQSDSVVIICVMDYTNDYRNSSPALGVFNSYNGYFTDVAGFSKDPYIEYTVATGYGNKVCGVIAANVSKVSGVATANIEKVIGV